MSIARLCRLAPALALASGLVSSEALADHITRHERDRAIAHRAHGPRVAWPHHRRVGHVHDAPPPGWGAPGRQEPLPWTPGYTGRGFVFVPGRGIPGEDCNMPTSTCPNEMRDVQ